ncbi:MAG: DUF4384 domain-containing protein [Phycisphaerae bacterium]
MTRRAIKVTVLLAALGFVGSLPAKAANEPGSKGTQVKDIFYVPDVAPVPPGPSAPLRLAVKYKILLHRPGFTGTVPETYPFQKGDRFQIIFEGNAKGYIYLFNKGTSGRSVVLFPDKRINHGVNLIPSHIETVIPATGWYEFDEKTGTEEVYLFYTPKKIQDLEAPVASGVIPEAVWQGTVKPMMEQHAKRVSSGATKDIIYVEDGLNVKPSPSSPQLKPERFNCIPATQPNTVTATYAATQTTDGDGLLIHEIKLCHK